MGKTHTNIIYDPRTSCQNWQSHADAVAVSLWKERLQGHSRHEGVVTIRLNSFSSM